VVGNLSVEQVITRYTQSQPKKNGFTMPPQKRGRTKSRSSSRRRTVSRSSSYGAGQRSIANMESTAGANLIQGRNHRAQWNSAPGWSLNVFDPFPARIRARLRYNEVVSIDSTVGFPGHALFRANGLYDPNYTGVGHQPMGLDQYALLYNHYKVVSSVISVTPGSAFNSSFGIGLSDDATTSTDFYGIAEEKGTKWAMNSSASTVPTVTNYYNKNYFPSGVDGIGALIGADPSEQVFFDVWSRGLTISTEDTAKDFNVCIEYIVDFWELKSLGQS